MEELSKLISDVGVTVIIVTLFLWDWINNKKKINKTLEQNTEFLGEIKSTNKNVAKSLELLQKSMEGQNILLVNHDKRCETIEQTVNRINEKIK